MKLVIVESPTKSKSIGRYLGEDYVVEASVGHIRDLSIRGKGGFGVDVDNDFKPTYVIDKDKTDVVRKLKKLKKECDEVILATDPDREGEAIAYHLACVLDLPIETTKRLEFHEITKDSILEAIENPTTIKMDLVHSQEARRIIDRIIGFKLSTLMKSKIGSKSAGRVQSVTLKMLVEHEKDILAFEPEEYWTIDANILKDEKKYKLDLVRIHDKTYKLKNESEADEVLSFVNENVKVTDIKKVNKSTSSKEPFRTSTLQQEVSAKYRFKTKETTFLAQQLYEGVEINGELKGLITYIRTDSTKLSDAFVNKAKSYILKNYGEEYYEGPKAQKNVKLAQDAHEAIRPTDLSITPSVAKKYLTDHLYKVYKLIYERTLASLMKDKIEEVTTVTFKNSNLTLELKGNRLIFNGYDVFKLDNDEVIKLPEFKVDEEFNLIDVTKEQHFTKPPQRYTEGKIIKLMEEKGIGRPSTYSSTIQTLVSRKYVTNTKGVLAPTEQGILTSNVLNKYFTDLMNTEYTAEMETNLDKISEGELDSVEVIREFYHPFIEHYDVVKDEMYKEPQKLVGEKCPICGSELVYKNGKHGQFIGCSNYPKCTYIKKEQKEPPRPVGRDCPNCGAPLVYRKNKKGQEFIGCSKFPKCKYIESLEPQEEIVVEDRYCPECGAKLVLRRSKKGPFYGCSNYPKCTHVEPIEKKND